ncbi:MAG: 3-dehydroquinate synthase [Fuerstiella sp.]|nr:3-dehydroquinate synthase [Fuerstiella sp.]
MNVPTENEIRDATFAVEFTHRLRFTHDVFGGDAHTLTELLESSEGRIPKVQFWLDDQVSLASPDLKHRIQRFCSRHDQTVQVTGNIQVVPGGEGAKNDIHLIERMLKCFNHADLDRRSYVIVIGGGAVLDAVGFAVAIAHRGLRLIRIPTTTLAQGDSGIGVKNSINLFQKKNWVGTFAVPWAVINDRKLIETLSDRDFCCGFSEAVKVSLLKSGTFFEHIHRDAPAIRQRKAEAWAVIAESAQWHLRHITAGGDPFEMLEARPLDYGHWSAHKLEVMTGFELRHGEAVAIGVAVDTIYSSMAHGLSPADADRILDCLEQLGLLLDHPALQDTEALFSGLEEFRQHLGGRLTVTMLDGIGRPIDVHEIDHELMRQAISVVAERVGRSRSTT